MASNPAFSYGLIAGGMNDGYVHVWDPAKVASGESDQLIASVEQHQGDYMLKMSQHMQLMYYAIYGCRLFLRAWILISFILDSPSLLKIFVFMSSFSLVVH